MPLMIAQEFLSHIGGKAEPADVLATASISGC